MDICIRLATPVDAPRCAEIHADSWRYAYRSSIPADCLAATTARFPRLWEKLLANNTDTQYVITKDEKILGFIGLMQSRDADASDDTFEIGAIYFDPGFIGKGYGRQTVAWAKSELTSRGAKQLTLWVLDENHRAKAFYRACGFRPDGTSKPSGLGDRTEERMMLFV